MLIFTASKIDNGHLLEVQQMTIPMIATQAHQEEGTRTPLQNTVTVYIQGPPTTVMTAMTTMITMTEAATETATEKNVPPLTGALAAPAAVAVAVVVATGAEAPAPAIDLQTMVARRVEKLCLMGSR